MTIRAFSFNFEGCLFNKAYEANLKKFPYTFCRSVLEANDKLLTHIKHTNKDYRKTIGFVGSIRQSKQLDQYENYLGPSPTGSCFIAMKTICGASNIELDPLLLADIYGNLPAGTSFNKVVYNKPLTLSSSEHASALCDLSKVTTVYAQIHKLALEHPNESIDFYYFDADGNPTNPSDNRTLETLYDFFLRNPWLIPTNISLKLTHYAGDRMLQLPIIKGLGKQDIAYRQTVLDMVAQVPKTYSSLYTTCNVARELLQREVDYYPPLIALASTYQSLPQLKAANKPQPARVACAKKPTEKVSFLEELHLYGFLNKPPKVPVKKAQAIEANGQRARTLTPNVPSCSP